MALSEHLNDPGEVNATFGMQAAFEKDQRPNKINLILGAYIEENETKPCIMKAIKKAEERLQLEEESKSYLSMAGDDEYLSHSIDFVFGKIEQSRVAAIQTVGGTSAIRNGLEFLKKSGYKKVAISEPTWGNHIDILKNLDFEIVYFPRNIEDDKGFSLTREFLKGLGKDTVLFLQSMNHNPTGIDFTKHQWKEISLICKKYKLFPFLDSAYQGFSVSLEEDVWPIRYFFSQKHEMMVTHSFSKSFGIYSERVGALFVATKNKGSAQLIKKNLKKQVCVTYGPPPSHGSNIIKRILSDASLKKMWDEELTIQRKRIKHVRKLFSERVVSIFGKKISNSIGAGHGFFCILPLSVEEITILREEFAIYIGLSGRVSFSSFQVSYIDKVVDALAHIKPLDEKKSAA